MKIEDIEKKSLAVGVFPNREEAVSNCPPSYLGTIKIEWEE